MATTTFGKITTNRVTLKKFIEQFKKHKQEGESFISPRPMPGKMQPGYFGLMRLSEGSRNNLYFTAHRNFKPLTEDEYEAEREAIKYFWEA